MNLGKTKVIIFHTSSAVRSAATFTAVEGGRVDVVTSYVYLGVTFTSLPGPFTMRQVAPNRLTQGYAALAMLERRYH